MKAARKIKTSATNKNALANKKTNNKRQENILFSEYANFIGQDAQNVHLRKEFCSQLLRLPNKFFILLIRNQSVKSLKQLMDSLNKFVNFDTGTMVYQKEMEMIAREINKRRTFKGQTLSNAERKKIIGQIEELLS